MDPQTPHSGFRLSRLPVILLVIILTACSDEEVAKVKFSGTVTTLQDNGDVGPVAGISVDIRLYNNPLLMGDNAKKITVVTDEDGHYELIVPRGKYNAYDVRVTDDYYRVCYGALEPLLLLFLREMEPDTNTNDISVCLTSRYKIVLHNNSGSANSVTVATGGRIGNILMASGADIPVAEDTYIHFLPNVVEVTFSFTIKNAAGEIIDTFHSTHVPVPGSTEVIDIEY